MADHTHIEWSDATWNPITGCSVVSAGCKHCYAMKLAGTRLKHHPSRKGLTRDTKAGPVWTGEVRFNEQWLTQPLKWTRPRMIFVCAHGDLFAENVPDEWIDRIFAVMAICPQHTFQVLTKRPERMRTYLDTYDRSYSIGSALGDMLDGDWIWNEGKPYRTTIEGMISLAHGMGPDCVSLAREEFLPLPNVWLGVSVEDQKTADQRIPLLLDTPAAIRWVSYEPALGPVGFTPWLHDHGCEDVPSAGFCSCGFEEVRLDWIVAGGESGPNARPAHPDWFRAVRDQCAAANVPFLFKQWGEWASVSEVEGPGEHFHFDDGATVRGVGKKRAGRLLDGVLHDAYPEPH